MRNCEFLTLFRRVGALHLFNPYDPDYRWELDCMRDARKDERKVINILVLLEQKEPQEHWLNESRDWLKFDAPANWTTDEGLPHAGVIRVSFNTKDHCADVKLRSGLSKYCAVGRGKGYCIPDEKRKAGTQEREEALKVAEAVREATDEEAFKKALAQAHAHGSDDEDFDPFATKKKKKKVDPLSWRTIDVYDIVRDSLVLRSCISGAVEDGDVDKQELREIVRILAKSGHPESTRKQVYEALGDNDMDEGDRELLMGLIPPDPKSDWDRTINLLEKDRGFLTTVFRFYGTQGGGGGDSADIGADEWRLFCKVLKLPPSAGLKTSIDTTFVRANQDRSPIGVDYFVHDNLQAAAEAETKQSKAKDNQMEIKEFVAGIIRLAQAVFPTMISISARVEKLIEDHIRPQCTKVLAQKDEISELLEITEVQEGIAEVGKVLYDVFTAYAEADMSGPKKPVAAEQHGFGTPEEPVEETEETINEKEFLIMLADGNLIDNKLTKREVRQIFLKVNLDDDIAGDAEGGEVTSSGSELDFDEFVEVICRIAVEKRGDQVEKNRNASVVGHPDFDQKETGMTFEAMVVAFVEETIAPLLNNFKAGAASSRKGKFG